MSESALEGMGWEVLIIWECETLNRDTDDLLNRLVDFLDEKRT